LEALSDNALMMRVKEGDLDNMSPLFERYKKPLYGFFYGLNREQELLSEDLVQNTFLRILKYRHLFRGEPAGPVQAGATLEPGCFTSHAM
jgi:DNA-directed RNA polymerase specialized sigma24 family protein